MRSLGPLNLEVFCYLWNLIQVHAYCNNIYLYECSLLYQVYVSVVGPTSVEDPVQLLMKDAGKSHKLLAFDLGDLIIKMKIVSIDSHFVELFLMWSVPAMLLPHRVFALFYLSYFLLVPLSSSF